MGAGVPIVGQLRCRCLGVVVGCTQASAMKGDGQLTLWVGLELNPTHTLLMPCGQGGLFFRQNQNESRIVTPMRF